MPSRTIHAATQPCTTNSPQSDDTFTPSALVQGEGSAEQVPPAVPDAKQNDHALNAAVIEAANHPERAAALAARLGIGTTAQQESVLHQTLRGEAFPPPGYDSWWDAPPAGAFDGGVTRVMGEDESYFLTKISLSPSGQPWVTDETDRVEDVRLQVTNSYGFARYVGLLMTAIEMAKEDGNLRGVEYEVSQMAAVAFLAGWYMGQEYQDAKRSARTNTGGAK